MRERDLAFDLEDGRTVAGLLSAAGSDLSEQVRCSRPDTQPPRAPCYDPRPECLRCLTS
jgi:hypothetical protein